MQECDHAAARTRARTGVNRAMPCRLRQGEGLLDVVYPKGDVVEAFSARAEKLRERSVIFERLEQFELGRSGVQESHPHTLPGQIFLVGEDGTEGSDIDPRGLLNAAHGDPDMIEPHEPLRISSAAV